MVQTEDSHGTTSVRSHQVLTVKKIKHDTNIPPNKISPTTLKISGVESSTKPNFQPQGDIFLFQTKRKYQPINQKPNFLK